MSGRKVAAVAAMALALSGCGWVVTDEERHQERIESIRRQGELADACVEAGGNYVHDNWNGNHCEFDVVTP